MSRVLLVYHNSLFAHSIRVALSGQPQIALIGEVMDWEQIETEIAQLVPDVVILEEDERDATEALLSALHAKLASWRVVALRLDETAMHIWSGRCQRITRQEDLIDALAA